MWSKKCVFCEICSKREAAEFVYEDEEVVVFKDIKPVGQHHYLSVPTKHIQNVNKLDSNHKELVEKLVSIAKKVLQEKGCDLNDILLGFHLPPFNSVSHLHLHVIAPASELSFYQRAMFRENSWWFATAEAILNRLENK